MNTLKRWKLTRLLLLRTKEVFGDTKGYSCPEITSIFVGGRRSEFALLDGDEHKTHSIQCPILGGPLPESRHPRVWGHWSAGGRDDIARMRNLSLGGFIEKSAPKKVHSTVKLTDPHHSRLTALVSKAASNTLE